MIPGELVEPHKMTTVPICVALLLASSCALSGCKTSKDAAEAATQMSHTAKALCDYYTTVRTIFENTDEIYHLNHDLYSKPYPPDTQKELKDNEAELAKRAELASDFSALADSFGKLTGSKASTAVATSAGKLNTEIDALASVKASSTEQTAIKSAMQALVTAIQEQKERQASEAMDDAVKGLRDLFDEEEDVWNAREVLYSDIASNLAVSLVEANATDNMPLLKLALDPFGLIQSAASPEMNAKLAPAAINRIQTKKVDMDSSFQKATSDMSKALHTMAERIDTVAKDKAMDFHSTPVTVSSVEQWASQFAAK
jgi:hypothetical protein